MKLFRQINDAQYKAFLKVFAPGSGGDKGVQFWDYIAHCVSSTLKFGDRSHVNHAARVAVFCRYGPVFRKFVPIVVPFKFDRKTMTFVGPILGDKRKSLLTFDAVGVEEWERILRAGLNGDPIPKEVEPKRRRASKTPSKRLVSGGLPSLGKRR